MIRNIPSIKSFGVFADYRWKAGTPDFKRFNLIYGWNYSGKTTLSRAFRCFELKEPHKDFPDAEVELLGADGTTHELSAPNTAPEFRVFNTDFIRDNLSFDESDAEPILVLGSDDIKKQEALKAAKAERDKFAIELTADEKTLDKTKADIEKGLREHARDTIKNPLGIPNYDKTRFEPKVVARRTDWPSHLLDDDSLNECFSVFRSNEKRPALSEKTSTLSSVADFAKETAALLAQTVTAGARIARFDEDPKLEQWIKDGRLLHDGKSTCQFCGQALPADLMAHLAGHFSADYDNLMSGLAALIKRVGDAKGEEITLDHEASFYPELAARFGAKKSELDSLLKARKAALSVLENALVSKQTKAFSNLPCPATDDPGLRIDEAITDINGLINEHNARTVEFEQKKQEAFDRIEMHQAAAFVRDKEYNERSSLVERLTTKIGEQRKRLPDVDNDIRQMEREISEASKGAERINDLLAAYFGKDDLRIEVSPDKRFQIVRGGAKAKNLSEGEKTAIAFAHFITRVQDGRRPLADTIVVIDDPISSLDASHLFNTYALIKTQLAECCQLFISTHSFDFYNLVREWAVEHEDTKKPQADWKRWSIFFLKRTDDLKAALQEIPKELLRFKSEYHYLFALLREFDKAGPGEFDSLLSLPNVVRRFMEAFGGIMIPLSIGLRGKMDRLFADPVERERVWKFINHYSHNTTITRSLTIPDTSECKAVVESCLKAVKTWNEAYFNDLEQEVA
jgi:wobble nucleotide-excising tRNase